MKTYLSVLVLILALAINANWVLEEQVIHSIFNPENIWQVGNDSLIINDLGINLSPINLVDVSKDTVLKSLKTGQGPSETSSTFYKRITKFSNGDILLWDAGLNRITKYESNLNYIVDMSGSAFNKRFYQAAVINDSTLMTIDNTEDFLKVWRLEKDRINTDNLLWSLKYRDYESLGSLSNFILLQTMYYDNFDGVLYIAFEFSSIILAIDEDGVIFINDKPDLIPLPKNKDQQMSLPAMGKHPEGARDVSVDGKYVYLLFSGETISRFEQMKYTFNFEILIDKVKHTKRLLLFDRITGEFVKETELPVLAKDLKIKNNVAYLLNSLEDVPKILKYRVDDF